MSDSDDEVEEVYTPAALKRQPPPQLQQAMRMMKLGRDSGNPELLQRAEILAKEAMELDPTLRQNFDKVSKMHAAGMDPKDIPAAFTAANSGESMDVSLNKASSVSNQIGELKKQMEDQLAALKRSEDELTGKTNSLEGLAERQNPEELAAFLEHEGLSEDDIRKALEAAESGDEHAAKEIFEKLSAGDADTTTSPALEQVEKMASAVQIANSIGDTKKQHFSGGKSKHLSALENQKAKLLDMQRSLMEQTQGAAERQEKAKAELAAAEDAMGKASAKVDAAASKLSPADVEENMQELKQSLKGEGWGGGFLGKNKLKEREEKAKEKKAKEAKEAEGKRKESESARRAQVQARVQAALAGRAAPAVAPTTTPAVTKPEKPAPTSTTTDSSSSVTSESSIVIPTYTLKRLVSGAVRAIVSLPDLESMQGLELDISERELSLTSTADAKHCYRLKIKFEQSIHREAVKAKFNKSARELRITLPLPQ